MTVREREREREREKEGEIERGKARGYEREEEREHEKEGEREGGKERGGMQRGREMMERESERERDRERESKYRNDLANIFLRWTGHVARMNGDGESLPKTILFSQLENCHRIKGVPRLRFKDTLKRNTMMTKTRTSKLIHDHE